MSRRRRTSTGLAAAMPDGRLGNEFGDTERDDPLLVLAVLEHGSESAGCGLGIERVQTECDERIGPVDRLRDAGWLDEIDGAQPLGGCGHLFGELCRCR